MNPKDETEPWDWEENMDRMLGKNLDVAGLSGRTNTTKKRQWEHTEMWQLRRSIQAGGKLGLEVRRQYLQGHTVRVLHMNPINWPLLMYVHPAYRKIPIRYVIRHIKAGVSQQWDWGQYAHYSNTD
jgi:hypothetical protein